MEVDVSGPAVRGLPRREIGEFATRCQQEISRRGYAALAAESFSIVFVDDAAMAELNGEFRGKQKTTDVLTFPADEHERQLEANLGEIVISLDQAARQAAEERHSLATELRYLILHGMLHAHGYDHETDDGLMDRIETEIRPSVGLQ